MEELKHTFNFGKIDYLNIGRKTCPVKVDVEIRKRGGEETFIYDPETGEKTVTGKTPEYFEFAATGWIYNHLKTDIYAGGQCLDTIANYVKSPAFKTIYKIWKKYHLNSMHAGTPEQTKCIEEREQAGNKYDYKKACELLKENNLYEIPFTGKTIGRFYNNELYRYGAAWIIEDLPETVYTELNTLINGR